MSKKDQILVRQHYIDRIKPFINQSLIKVLVGQRRVGKSYVLLQLMEYIKNLTPNANIIYINKEDLLFRSLQTGIDLYDFIQSKRSKKGMNYIFVDEIQDIKNFEDGLRSLLLNKKNDIYITGSNAKLLSSDLAGHLSGRYIEFEIHSLAYSEFLQFHKLKADEKSFENYLKFGGLPYLIHLELKENIVFDYIKSVYSTILYRDVVNRYSIRNIQFLERLSEYLAQQIGSLFSAKSISDYLKSQQVNIPSNLVQTYAGYLASACLLHRVERYNITGKRKFEIGEKYYFEDLGIRNAMVGYSPADRAKLLENIVYNHLKFKGYEITVGVLGDKEVDFIAEKNNEIQYFQVALRLSDEQTVEREFGNLLAIKDNYPKHIVTKDFFSGNTYKGIKHWDILTFLTSFK
jgi:predicted AAA+ superfamily ATPase